MDILVYHEFIITIRTGILCSTSMFYVSFVRHCNCYEIMGLVLCVLRRSLAAWGWGEGGGRSWFRSGFWRPPPCLRTLPQRGGRSTRPLFRGRTSACRVFCRLAAGRPLHEKTLLILFGCGLPGEVDDHLSIMVLEEGDPSDLTTAVTRWNTVQLV
jgi:hypothetical protein